MFALDLGTDAWPSRVRPLEGERAGGFARLGRGLLDGFGPTCFLPHRFGPRRFGPGRFGPGGFGPSRLGTRSRRGRCGSDRGRGGRSGGGRWAAGRSSSAAIRADSASSIGSSPSSTKRSIAVSSSNRALPPDRAPRERVGEHAQRADEPRLRHRCGRAVGVRRIVGGEIARQQFGVDARDQQVAELCDEQRIKHRHVGPGVARRRRSRAAPPPRRRRASRRRRRRANAARAGCRTPLRRSRVDRRPSAKAATCSSMVSASRKPPSARYAIAPSAASSIVDALGPAISRMRSIMTGIANAAERVALTARENRRRQLFGRGRREDEHRLLRRLLERLEKRVRALFGEHVRFVDDVDFRCASLAGANFTASRSARISSMPRLLAASISSTSNAVPSRIATAVPHVLSGVGVGPLTQLMQRAKILAAEVLPEPRGPENR